MNGSNQLGAVSDPPEKRAARALSLESRETGAGYRGGQRGRSLGSGVRASRIDRARCRPQPRPPPPPCHSADADPLPATHYPLLVPASPPGRPARARVWCAAADMAGARPLVAVCCCWWWLTIAAGKYSKLYSTTLSSLWSTWSVAVTTPCNGWFSYSWVFTFFSMHGNNEFSRRVFRNFGMRLCLTNWLLPFIEHLLLVLWQRQGFRFCLIVLLKSIPRGCDFSGV